MAMAVRVKMQMLSLLSYVLLLNCKYIHRGKEFKRLPPLIIYLKHEKEFVVTVVSGMHSETTVLSGSERQRYGAEQWQVGGRCAQLSRSRRKSLLLFSSLPSISSH